MASGSPDDYYLLLGIEPDADAAQLRRAWRRLALRWHPDRAGPAATARFQSISAAYAVLSDPAARAAYDQLRAPAAAQRPAPRSPSAPPPKERAPSVMLSRQTGSLTALLAQGVARRAESGVIELFLNAEEAAQGGMVSVSMRVAALCPDCAEGDSSSCARCKGTGATDELFSAWLAVRPGVKDGAMLAPSAQLPGVVQEVSFRIRVRGAR